jgi:23S rRNA (cytosine1962-C5)-methyltransferase
MSHPKAFLTPKGEKWFRSGHPWIFQDDVSAMDPADNGEIVALHNRQALFLGWAFYSRYSRITFRLISSDPQPIDSSYWRSLLQRALGHRENIRDRQRACRLFFSEADGIPGLIADWYAGHLIIQTLIPGTERLLPQFGALLRDLLQPASILIRNDQESRSIEQLPQEIRVFSGTVPENIQIQEGPIHYWVDLQKGQKTGAYLDQQHNRMDLSAYVQGHGRVLDCFCFTGGFSLHLAGKAREVLAVDDSAPALEWGRKNAALNGFSNILFSKKNVFDFLKEIDAEGQRFDLLILDPPPFAKKKSVVPGALKGYLELNRRAIKCLNPGGILSTYSCSYHITESLFLELVSQAAVKARRRATLLTKRMQAPDHPVLLNFPESLYLKGVDVRVE